MKHILKIVETFEFDHSQNNMGKAMGADYELAKALALASMVIERKSKVIEKLMFESKAPLKTRILSVFMAGVYKAKASEHDLAPIKKSELPCLIQSIIIKNKDIGFINDFLKKIFDEKIEGEEF